MKTSDLLVRCLEQEGIEYIFGVPGEENADFMLSLEGSSIQFVLTRHEQGAAFMAEVYGRLTGNPAGCLGTLGPGATNLLTGVADANMDRAPLLCITGQGATARQHKESHQIMDVVGMYEPVTKWAQTIYNAATVAEVVRKAFKVAEAEKPGATVIELPEDVAKHMVDTPPLAPKMVRRPAADHKAVAQAIDIIAGASNPVILAGNGCVRKRASHQLRRFCDATGIGVLLLFIPDPALRDAIIGRMPLSLPAVFAISVTILLILRVVSFIGARNLLHLMTGRYQRPMVEDRAFLFIDLKDSTRITEALGVVRAREFISDFIFDVSKAITDHRGDVYKFMGDGIIAVWQHQDKGALTDAVAAVVAAERTLTRRADRYDNRFGHIPEFRAGLHAGEVIASEQGDLRRSIEFNGDHINIAARLEQKAKEHGRTLVFSEVVAEALHDTGVPTESLDEETVKGYSRPLRLYCLKV